MPPPDNVINFSQHQKKSRLTISKLPDNHADDPLNNCDLHSMMRDYHTSGVFRSLLFTPPQDVGFNKSSYAEQKMTHAELRVYGVFTPFRGTNKSVNGDNANGVLRRRLVHDVFVRRIWQISSCCWWYCQPLSRGLLQMLVGNQTERYRKRVQNAVSFLQCEGFLESVPEMMSQPIKPKGITFSRLERQVLWASRRALYHDIECAMFATNAMRKMHDNHLETMVEWSNRPWPNDKKSTQTAPMDAVTEGKIECHTNY